jgi:hypothetical protein
MIKSRYITDILELLLDGDKDGLLAKQQIPFLYDSNYDYTGQGVFVRFEHDIKIEEYRLENEFYLCGVKIQTEEYTIEADAILFSKDGLIDYLEIWCYNGEDYPKKDLMKYTLTQNWMNSPTKIFSNETTLLYRPVNQAELDLIKQSNWTKFPPRLPEQPIFYPVLNEAYAIQIAKEWNVPAYGVGYVTRFAVRTNYMKKYKVENVGGEIHNELWVPAEELEEFNSNIVGLIEVINEFRSK